MRSYCFEGQVVLILNVSIWNHNNCKQPNTMKRQKSMPSHQIVTPLSYIKCILKLGFLDRNVSIIWSFHNHMMGMDCIYAKKSFEVSFWSTTSAIVQTMEGSHYAYDSFQADKFKEVFYISWIWGRWSDYLMEFVPPGDMGWGKR